MQDFEGPLVAAGHFGAGLVTYDGLVADVQVDADTLVVEDDVEGCFVRVHALGGGGADREVFFGFYPEDLAKGSTQTPSIFSLSLCTLIFGIAAA
ncbi:hypothetical protein ACFZDJ_47510 [Streptomyces sp. NPDC007896]|uniref:hypothetical protein n=1 Tax=Streptomyces sp. NPDC007896 TaxID=3364784 RepID=UPI0036EDBAF8